MKKKLVSVLLASAMALSLAACGGTSDSGSSSGSGTESGGSGTEASGSETAGGEEEEALPENEISGDIDAADAFVVWGWNTDIQNILDGVYKDEEPDNYSRIVFVNTGGSDYYQTKIDAILDDTSNKLYPDLMGLEVDYVQKYVNSGYLLSNDDLGISSADMSEMYQYNIDLGTNKTDGKVYAFFWQATPGCFQLRADLAEQYLGTTDPDELASTVFKDVDTIVAKAQEVYEASDGNVALFGGYDELLRMFQNSRTVGWYDSNDVVTIDAQMSKYMETAAAIAPYTHLTSQWGSDWNAEKDGMGTSDTDKAAIAYCGCPWFTYFCLSDTWKNNTILVEAPYGFFWGGTGLAATVGCSDKDLAANIIKHFTCDTDFMIKINELNSDFVNNKAAVSAQAGKSNDYTANGQDLLGFYQPKANSIDASTVTAEDQTINSIWNDQVDAVAQQGKSIDDATAEFISKVVDTYSYLKAQ